jgi:hypothetical protein
MAPNTHDLTYFTPFRPTDPARARGCGTCADFQGRFKRASAAPHWPARE